MEQITFILFLGSFLVAIHTYMLYPISIYLISSFYPKSSKESVSKKVSIVISAFNEEQVISQRLENLASLDYDFENLEVLIGSDNSDDNTNNILLKAKDRYPWLKIFIFNQRRGKASVVNDLVDSAQNEIIVFSDANTIFDKNALRKIVADFENENVGGVCGRLILTDTQVEDNQSVEEVKYWNYETFIKKAEGRCGTLIGANGGIYAIRKMLLEKLPSKQPVTDDLFHTLVVLKKNYEFIYREDAIAYEEVGKSVRAEFVRKVRFSATNFQTLSIFKSLLYRGRLLTMYAFFSHKILRWILPIVLVLLFSSNLLLINYSSITLIFFFVQLLFLFLSLVGFILNYLRKRISLFSLPFFFIVANIAVTIGMFKFFGKKHSYIWEKTER